MRRAHLAAWAPRCPVCAETRGATSLLGLAEGATERDGTVETGRLVCADPTCRHEYPVIDGIPIITARLTALLRERGVELMLRTDLDEAILGMLGDALGPDSWLDVMRQGLSTYGWDAYADLDPAEVPGTPEPGAARRCLARLLALTPSPTRAPERILDLGCAAGRTSFDCAAAHPGALVLGIDTNLGLLRIAQRVSSQGIVAYGRRRIGMVYDERRFPAALPGRERVDFWACDAAALPFEPGRADLVLALNLLDCVPDPTGLLHTLMAALRPRGRLLLATPFDWAARATPAEQWIGGHSARGTTAGAAEPLLSLLLRPGSHGRSVQGAEVLATAEEPWHTRLHDRASVLYRTHLVVAERVASVRLDFGSP